MHTEKQSTKINLSGRGGARPGAGRPKGAPNKLSQDLRAMILGALDAVDGQTYLEGVAKSDPRTFCALLGRILPTTLAGDEANPLQTISRVEFVIIDAPKPTSGETAERSAT
jgi:hypothetical protein